MITNLAPADARALVESKKITVIDVREPHEWAEGHLPGARLISLGDLKANWSQAEIPDSVLFVCARGGRSQTAATLAELHGLGNIFNLEGGTIAWIAAGLPITHPPPAQPASAPAAELEKESDPALSSLVAQNLKELRAKRQLTLDMLAGLSGVGRQTLGQLEIGRATPSIETMWKIAGALDVPFSALLASPSSEATRVFRVANAPRIPNTDGRFSSRALFTPDDSRGVEFYELWLAAHAREDAEAHAPGTREHLIVTSGRLVLSTGDNRYELAKGDAITFVADTPHSYINPAAEECWMNLVMTYAR